MDKVIVPPTDMESLIADALQHLVRGAGLQLHRSAAELVARFAVQLATKLALAEQQHGYSDGWMERGHADHFRAELRNQVAKGDPLDVAAYCAFLWHHGDTAATGEAAETEAARLRNHSQTLKLILWRMSSALGMFGHVHPSPPQPETEVRDFHRIIDSFFERVDVRTGGYTAHTSTTPACQLQQVFDEVERATRKFPTWPDQGLHALAILGEEFGELNRAMLQMVYEPHKVTREDIHTEAIQTAAMALRLVMSLDRYRYDRSEQHSQGAQQ